MIYENIFYVILTLSAISAAFIIAIRLYDMREY